MTDSEAGQETRLINPGHSVAPEGKESLKNNNKYN